MKYSTYSITLRIPLVRYLEELDGVVGGAEQLELAGLGHDTKISLCEAI